MPGHAGRALFVGRQRERTLLLERLRAAGRGEGSVALVAGEPGIGKTRLLEELADGARAAGWSVIGGRAYETEGLPPYLPFVEALSEWMEACSDAELGACLGGAAAEVALLAPQVGARLGELPALPSRTAEAARYSLFEGVSAMLVRIGCGTPPPDPLPSFARAGEPRSADGRQESPPSRASGAGDHGAETGLLLVLDDLQWADRGTLLLIEHVARKLAGAPLLVAGAYRSVEVDRAHPLTATLAALAREGVLEQVLLGPFAPEESAAAIAAVSGVSPAPSVVSALHRQTAGNPFFLREMTRHLAAEGRDLGAETGEPDRRVPQSVRSVIGSRLARLSSGAVRLLEAAAVLGDGFTVDLLGNTSRLAAGPLLDGLDETLRAGLLRETGEAYAFSHDLVRQTLYAELPLHRRQRLHLRAAEAIDQTPGLSPGRRTAAMAGHYRLAGPATNPGKAIDAARRAGEAALAVFAWEEAADFFRTMLEAADNAPPGTAPLSAGDRFHILMALAEAEHKAGNLSVSTDTFGLAAELARRIGEPEKVAVAALGFGEYRILWERYHERQIALLEEALVLLGEGDSALRAKVLGLLAEIYADEPAEHGLRRSLALGGEAVALARRLGDPAVLAYTLNEQCWALSRHGPGHDKERFGLATEMLQLAAHAGDRELALKAHRWRILDLLEMGNVRDAGVELTLYEQIATDLRHGYSLWVAAIWRTVLAIINGRFEDAERLAQETHTRWSGRLRLPVVEVNYLRHMHHIRRDQGRLRELEPAIEEEARQTRHPILQFQRLRLASYLADVGRTAEARVEFERVATNDFIDLPLGTAGVGYFFPLIHTCVALSDEPRAALLYERLQPWNGRNLTFYHGYVLYGAAAHYLGMLAATMERWEAGEAHFEEALAMHARMGARPLLAHTRREYAAMLLKRHEPGDRDRARGLIEAATAAYDELDMAFWAAKARGLLDAAPVAAGRAVAYPTGLTEREVEVLRLLAAGRTNPEIAASLVLSAGTVARHTANIYAKIGARGRAEAVAFAVRSGLMEL